MKNKEYLGDSVHISVKGPDLIFTLTTENDGVVTNAIIITPDILEAMGNYLMRTASEVTAEAIKKLDLT